MKILLCIGIILLIILSAVGVYMVCRIAACQYLQTKMMAAVNPGMFLDETGNRNPFEGLHIWEEIPNCTLLMQCYFNCPQEFYITDFSKFTEKNRLVGLQLFDTRKVLDLNSTEPVVLKNITLRKISDEGDPEENSCWLWYFPDQENWSNL